jgi:hypothetical protein
MNPNEVMFERHETTRNDNRRRDLSNEQFSPLEKKRSTMTDEGLRREFQVKLREGKEKRLLIHLPISTTEFLFLFARNFSKLQFRLKANE